MPPTVLIVDDEPDMLDVLPQFVHDVLPDARVVCAASGAAALELLAREAVAIVLCDYRMPDVDGIEVLRRCAQLAPQARRVLMTAFADSSLPARTAAYVTLDGFIEKAGDPARLRAQLARIAPLVDA